MNNKNNIALFLGFAGIIVGFLITLLGLFYYDAFMNFIFICIGVIMVLVNIFPLLLSAREMKYNKRFAYNFFVTLSFVILGIIFIFDHDIILSIVFGSFLIVLPLIRVILARNHKKQFLNELPLLLLGTVLFFNFRDSLFHVAIVSFGIVLALISLGNVAFYIIKNKDSNDEIIEVEAKEVK